METPARLTATPRSVPRANTRIPGPLAVQRVISAYDDAIIRGYSWGRFKIFRQRFLDEIGQYLPERGRVLDIGCGFGLFSLYYAQIHPELEITGFDLSPGRVEMAKRAAAKIGADRASFRVQNAIDLRAEERFDAIYMLDVIHHVGPENVTKLLSEVRASLAPGGVLLVKELDTEPAWQRIFAHVLDLAMSPSSPPRYWSNQELSSELERLGFDVKRHAMVDILPYPHVLYIARPR